MKRTLLALALTLVVPFAHGALINVSVESTAGSGTFDVDLGNIATFDTTDTIADFYSYTAATASYNGSTPGTISGTSQSFFVNASDGLNFVQLHDQRNDGSGGNMLTSALLAGDTAAITVQDDPAGGSDIYSSIGGNQFTASHIWVGCCTDGWAIGSLDGNWTLDVELEDLVGDGLDIGVWQGTSGDGANIALTNYLDNNSNDGRAVRFQVAAAAPISEPGILMMFAIGLIAIGVAARPRRRAH